MLQPLGIQVLFLSIDRLIPLTYACKRERLGKQLSLGSYELTPCLSVVYKTSLCSNITYKPVLP